MPRNRSASAHQKVLDAAFQLMAERGVEGTSMDAIAESSGVSKATIYKHWTDKDALLLEMMAEADGLHTRPLFNSGDTRADLIAVLSYRPPERAEMRERIMPHFMAYSAHHPSFGEAWRNMVMEPPRKELTDLLKIGIRKGELSPKIDLDLSLALLLGPIIYWKVFLQRSAEDPKVLAEGTVDAFWKAFGLNHGETKQNSSSFQPPCRPRVRHL
jgi:AcrR family transcriptional regulator